MLVRLWLQSSSMQSACAVLYCRLWPTPLYHVFPHFLINVTVFGKSYWTYKMSFDFLFSLSETFLVLRRIQRDTCINVHTGINVHTYLLTPWCRVLLEKLTGLQLVKKFPAFHGTRRFITALTSARHLSHRCTYWHKCIYWHKCTCVYESSTRHSCQILMKFGFSRQIF